MSAGVDEADLPKITIVTPSFRQARFLERTIRSVLDQGYPKLEYMIFDGGSTDGSADIIRRYESRLARWASEKDNGQSDAINRGLRAATGDVVGWLNSDDTLAPRALWRIAECYARRPDVDLVYGHTCLIDADDRVLRRLVAVPTTLADLVRYNRNVWSQPGTTWRKSLQDRIGLLDESLHFTMDNDYWIRAAGAGKIHCLPYHLANLRVHEGTKTAAQAERFEGEHQLMDRRHGAEQRTGWGRRWFNVRRRMRMLASPATLRYVMGWT